MQVARESGLEEDRVCPVLGEEEWHVTHHLGEPVQTQVPLLKVALHLGEGLGTARALERPPGSDLHEVVN